MTEDMAKFWADVLECEYEGGPFWVVHINIGKDMYLTLDNAKACFARALEDARA